MVLENLVGSLLQTVLSGTLANRVIGHEGLARTTIENTVEESKNTSGWGYFVDKAKDFFGYATNGLKNLSHYVDDGLKSLFGEDSFAYRIYDGLKKILKYTFFTIPYAIYYGFNGFTEKDPKEVLGISLGRSLTDTPQASAGISASSKGITGTTQKYIAKTADRRLEDHLDTAELTPGQRRTSSVLGQVILDTDFVNKYKARVETDDDGKRFLYVEVPSEGYRLLLSRGDDGVHEIHIGQRRGEFPQIYTPLKLELPEDTRALKFRDVLLQGLQPKLKAG